MKHKYLFIRLDDGGTTVKMSDNLDEFYSFCHYASLSDWNNHKKLIKKCIKDDNIYIFTGNDVWYYVIEHAFWPYIPYKLLTLNLE